MKLSELRLNTVYADHDGRPLIVLSLDRYAKPKVNYGTRNIRLADGFDKSFGVIILRQGHASRPTDFDDLSKTAAELRATLPEKEQIHGRYEVKVESLRLIVEPWDQHLERQRQAAEEKKAAALHADAVRRSRIDTIRQIEAALPARPGVVMSEHRNWAQVPLTVLLELVTPATPVTSAHDASFTPREMSLLAAGFDAAIKSLRHEDGTPVDVVHVKNPYRV